MVHFACSLCSFIERYIFLLFLPVSRCRFMKPAPMFLDRNFKRLAKVSNYLPPFGFKTQGKTGSCHHLYSTGDISAHVTVHCLNDVFKDRVHLKTSTNSFNLVCSCCVGAWQQVLGRFHIRLMNWQSWYQAQICVFSIMSTWLTALVWGASIVLDEMRSKGCQTSALIISHQSVSRTWLTSVSLM